MRIIEIAGLLSLTIGLALLLAPSSPREPESVDVDGAARRVEAAVAALADGREEHARAAVESLASGLGVDVPETVEPAVARARAATTRAELAVALASLARELGRLDGERRAAEASSTFDRRGAIAYALILAGTVAAGSRLFRRSRRPSAVAPPVPPRSIARAEPRRDEAAPFGRILEITTGDDL